MVLNRLLQEKSKVGCIELLPFKKPVISRVSEKVIDGIPVVWCAVCAKACISARATMSKNFFIRFSFSGLLNYTYIYSVLLGIITTHVECAKILLRGLKWCRFTSYSIQYFTNVNVFLNKLGVTQVLCLVI